MSEGRGLGGGEQRPPGAGDEADRDAALERIMAEVPRGAWALSGLTVGLLLLAWFLSTPSCSCPAAW